MDGELEQRWQRAEEAKKTGALEWEGCPTTIPKAHALLFKVTDPNYQGTAGDDWGQRCQASIEKEKEKIEGRYGIRIRQTDIRCAKCNKALESVQNSHVCSKEIVCQKKRHESVARVLPGERVYRWCEAKGQRIASEVCDNNLAWGECLKDSKGECRPKPKPMSEQTKQHLAELKKSNPKVNQSGANIGQKIKDFGRSRLATLLGLPVNTVSSWIKRGKIPKKHVDNVVHFLMPRGMGRTRPKMHHFAS